MSNHQTSRRRRDGLLALRWFVHVVFICMVIVWAAHPEDPSRLFRRLMFPCTGLFIMVMAIPAIRGKVLALLRSRLRVADLILWNLLLGFVLCELLLRGIGGLMSSPLLASPNAGSDRRIHLWRGRPHGTFNGKTLNALGLFDDDFQVERQAGVRRVAALADSFGVGVVPFEQNFLTLLDEYVDASCETEVLNFGIATLGPTDYLHLWRTEVRRYDPDQVLLCFFVGNDIEKQRHRRSILHTDSMLIFTMFKRLRAVSGEARNWEVMKPERPTFSEGAFREIELDRLAFCKRKLGDREGKAYEATFRVLKTISDEIGPRLCVAIVPDEFQVNDALYESLVGDRAGEYERRLPNKRLAEFFDRLGIPHLDLLEPLLLAQRDAPTYKPRDTHWNRLGNEVAARALADWLGDLPQARGGTDHDPSG